MTNSSPIGRSNRLLAALPEAVANALEQMEEIPLRRGDVLVESGPKYGHIYFPHSGFVSLVIAMPDGAVADAALVGREGLVGHPYLADFDSAPTRAIVQMDGHATRMPDTCFQRALAESPELEEMLGNFGRAFLAQTMQTAACNALHGLSDRLARWLLQIADMVDGDIPFTHEFLAEILSVSRPTISLTARALQTDGLIRYSRGHIAILNRRGLEAAACPCYRAIREAYDELLPLTYA